MQHLNEVIVTGYGTVKEKILPAQSLRYLPKDFQKGVISTPEQLIAGKVPGAFNNYQWRPAWFRKCYQNSAEVPR